MVAPNPGALIPSLLPSPRSEHLDVTVALPQPGAEQEYSHADHILWGIPFAICLSLRADSSFSFWKPYLR